MRVQKTPQKNHGLQDDEIEEILAQPPVIMSDPRLGDREPEITTTMHEYVGKNILPLSMLLPSYCPKEILPW